MGFRKKRLSLRLFFSKPHISPCPTIERWSVAVIPSVLWPLGITALPGLAMFSTINLHRCATLQCSWFGNFCIFVISGSMDFDFGHCWMNPFWIGGFDCFLVCLQYSYNLLQNCNIMQQLATLRGKQFFVVFLPCESVSWKVSLLFGLFAIFMQCLAKLQHYATTCNLTGKKLFCGFLTLRIRFWYLQPAPPAHNCHLITSQPHQNYFIHYAGNAHCSAKTKMQKR